MQASETQASPVNGAPRPSLDAVRALMARFIGGEDGRDRAGAMLTMVIRVASAGLAFFTQVLLARWLGAFEFGVFTYVWVWVNVLGTLAVMGFSTSAVRFLNEYAKPAAAGLARGFLRVGRLASFGAGALVMLAGLFFLWRFPGLADDHYLRPMMIGLLALPAFALTDFHDGAGRARQWIGLAFLPPYILRPLLLLVFTGAALWLGGARQATLAASALVAATWITALAQFALQHQRFANEMHGAPPRYRAKHWLWVSLPLLLMESFTLLMMNIDILLLELFVSPDGIARYFAAARTMSFVAFIHFAVSAVAMRRFALAFAERDAARAKRQLRRFRGWLWWPSLALTGLLLVAGPFILSLFGPGFATAWPVMAALAGGYLARALAGPVEALLVVSGRQKYTAAVTGLTAVLNIALNLMLIPRYGLLGAGLATGAAHVFQSLVLALAARRVLREGFAS